MPDSKDKITVPMEVEWTPSWLTWISLGNRDIRCSEVMFSISKGPSLVRGFISCRRARVPAIPDASCPGREGGGKDFSIGPLILSNLKANRIVSIARIDILVTKG